MYFESICSEDSGDDILSEFTKPSLNISKVNAEFGKGELKVDIDDISLGIKLPELKDRPDDVLERILPRNEGGCKKPSLNSICSS